MKILHLALEQSLERLAMEHTDMDEDRLEKAIGTAIVEQVTDRR
jgi:hypothetical protein